MSVIVGIDEVGRGSWAGPVVAAAVVLDKPIKGLRDSKLLSFAQREILAGVIRQRAKAISFGWTAASQVDELGLSEAVRRAMLKALRQITCEYDEIIIDGNVNFLVDNPKTTAVIKADIFIPSVSAASIIAKVARDNYMVESGLKYPGYQFENHVGYGTLKHRVALQKLGICDLHRKSYAPIQLLINNAT